LADNITGCKIQNCRIRNTGEYGIWIRGNCHSNLIDRCVIDDTGAGSIRLCDFPNKKNSAFNIIKNCSLTRGGRFHASSTAVWIGEGTDNTLTHNHIADHYYTGISIGWCWGYHGKSFRNEISYNLVENIGQAALGDMGGIYSLGTQTGTRILNNVFRNIDSYTYGGWGIYPDEGSEGLLIENNLVYNVKDGGFHQHYGKENTVRNNIFAYSRKDQIAATRIEQHLSVRFIGNIVYWDKPRDVFERASTEKVNIIWKKNMWFCESGEPLFKGKTFAQWQANGRDKEGFVGDPLFVNPGERDFRFTSDEACKKIGFTPFDFSKAGIEK
jgi:parallel beta-helix repeat protein